MLDHGFSAFLVKWSQEWNLLYIHSPWEREWEGVWRDLCAESRPVSTKPAVIFPIWEWRQGWWLSLGLVECHFLLVSHMKSSQFSWMTALIWIGGNTLSCLLPLALTIPMAFIGQYKALIIKSNRPVVPDLLQSRDLHTGSRKMADLWET